MSRSVDNRVVEMEFDNARFEKGVSQSLSTLDKLKAALSFKNVNDDFSNVENATEKLGRSFSALEAIAVGALMNIGSKVADWATKTIKELSGVENVIRGFQKFGDITKSSATLAAQGFETSEIESQLKRLNWFTDETSYNLTDMVDNISKFTATGQGLTESADAMQGIALWAALSGQNAGTASRAMYQLSQAMGSGYMRLEDWKSIQNANMDTDEFRQHVLDAAVALGTLRENADGTYQSLIEGLKKEGGEAFTKSQFTKNLTSGMWFTKEVMMQVYSEYAKGADQIYEYIKSHAGATVEDALDALGDSLDEFGVKAFKAGQEARTWEDAIESVKDALSTKWMGIFQNIFGNFTDATKFFTDLSYAFYDMFVEPMSTYTEAFARWDEEGGSKLLRGKVVEALYAINDLVNGIRDSFSDFFGWSEVSKEIENAAEAQKKANKVLQFRDRNYFSDETIAEAEAAEQKWRDLTEKYHMDYDDTEDLRQNYLIGQRTGHIQKLTDAFSNFVDKIQNYSDETRVFERILNGVYAMIDLIKQAVAGVWNAIKPFFGDVWWLAQKALGVFASIGDWFVSLNSKVKQGNILAKFFETLFAPIYNVRKALISFANELIPRLKEKFGSLSDLGENFSESLTGVKNTIKELISKIGDWWSKLFTNFDPKKTVDGLFRAVDAVKRAFYTITGIEPGTLGERIIEGINKIQNGLNTFKETAPAKIQETWEKVKGWFNTAFNWIKEHWEGIADDIKIVWDGVWGFIKGIWEGVKGLFQKDSEDGSSSMQSIIDSFKTFGEVIGNLITIIGNGLKPLADGLKNTIENMSLEGGGELLAGGGLAAIGAAILKFSENLRKSNVLRGINEVLGSFSKVLNGFAHTLDAKALKEAAVGIAILVASLFVLISLPADQLASAVVVLASVIAMLAKAMSKMGDITSSLTINKSGLTRDKNSAGMMFVEMAAGLLIIAFAMRALAKIPTDDLYTALGVIVIIVAVMTKAIKAMSKMYANKGDTNKMLNSNNKLNNNSIISMGGPAATLLAFALMMWVVAKTIGTFSDMISKNLGGFLGSFAIIVAIIGGMAIIVKKLQGVNIGSGVYKAILAFSAAIYVIAMAIDKLASITDPVKMGLASLIIFAIIALMGGILLGLEGKDMSSFNSIAKGMIAFSLAIAAIALVIYELSKISPEDLTRGSLVAAGIGVLLGAFAFISTWKKFDPAKFSSMAKSMVILGAAIGIIASVIYILAQLNNDQMTTGIKGLAAAVIAIAGLAVVAKFTGDGMEKVGKVFVYIATAAALLSVGLLAVVKALEILSGDTINVKKAFDTISDILDAFISKLPVWLAKISVVIVGFIVALIADLIIEFVNMIDDLIERFKDNDTIGKLVDGLCDVFVLVIDGITRNIDSIVASVCNLVLGILRSLGDWAYNNSDEITNALGRFVDGIIKVVMDLLDGLGHSIFHLITNEQEGDWKQFKTDVKNYVDALVSTIKLAFQPLVVFLQSLLGLFEQVRLQTNAQESFKTNDAGRLERLTEYFKNEVANEYRNQYGDWDTTALGREDYLEELYKIAEKRANEYWAKGYDVPSGTFKLLTPSQTIEWNQLGQMNPSMTPTEKWSYMNSVPSGTIGAQFDSWKKTKEASSSSNETNFTQNIYSPNPINPIDTKRYTKDGILAAYNSYA